MKPLITVGAFFKVGSHLLGENKKSLIIHYLTEFILGSIGVGVFVILFFIVFTAVMNLLYREYAKELK